MWVLVAIVAAAVAGAALLVGGTAGGYPLVKACGVSEFEGKAGYYAFFFVGAPLGLVGLAVGFWLVYRVRHVF